MVDEIIYDFSVWFLNYGPETPEHVILVVLILNHVWTIDRTYRIIEVSLYYEILLRTTGSDVRMI